MRKRLTASFAIVFWCAVLVWGQATPETTVPAGNDTPVVVASTSWTAAFADLAGIDGVEAIAPASLRHPPEYEITVDDIKKIREADVFVYAGFERMMQTIGDAIGNVTMVKIACDNSIETVRQSSARIAAVTHTEAESAPRVQAYVDTVEEGKAAVENAGLRGAKALVNRNQIYLAKDLGLDVAATFGPGPVTSDQIADAKQGGYAFIIDNVHNPVGGPLSEVAPDARYVVWRNFPERIEHDALRHVVQANIASLLGR